MLHHYRTLATDLKAGDTLTATLTVAGAVRLKDKHISLIVTSVTIKDFKVFVTTVCGQAFYFSASDEVFVVR